MTTKSALTTTNTNASTTKTGPGGRIQRARQTSEAVLDELNKAFQAHAELAKRQYAEFKGKYGDPMQPVGKARENATKLAKELEQSAKDLAAKAKTFLPGETTTTVTTKPAAKKATKPDTPTGE